MATFSEVEYSAYAEQTGKSGVSLSEQKLTFYNDQLGTNYSDVNEAEIAFLKENTNDDSQQKDHLWRSYLVDRGITYSNSLRDMLFGFYSELGFAASAGSGFLLLQSGDQILLQNGTDSLLLQADA